MADVTPADLTWARAQLGAAAHENTVYFKAAKHAEDRTADEAAGRSPLCTRKACLRPLSEHEKGFCP